MITSLTSESIQDIQADAIVVDEFEQAVCISVIGRRDVNLRLRVAPSNRAIGSGVVDVHLAHPIEGVVVHGDGATHIDRIWTHGAFHPQIAVIIQDRRPDQQPLGAKRRPVGEIRLDPG